LLDAYEEASDGLVGIMGCPRPKSPKGFMPARMRWRWTCSSQHMGVREPNRCIILRAPATGSAIPAAAWRSWHGPAVARVARPYDTEVSTLLSFLAYPVYVFGSGRGSLFVPEMDEKAFPPLQRETFTRRILRRGLRRLLGLHFPSSRARHLRPVPSHERNGCYYRYGDGWARRGAALGARRTPRESAGGTFRTGRIGFRLHL